MATASEECRTKLYDRRNIKVVQQTVEGLKFGDAPVPVAPKAKKQKKRPKPTPAGGNTGAGAGRGPGAGPRGPTNTSNLKEVLDLGDLPERLSDTAGLGNMPELTLLLEDDDVIDKFEDPRTAKLLREISMDPSRLEELKKEPEIQWMLDKIEEKKWLLQHDPATIKKKNMSVK